MPHIRCRDPHQEERRETGKGSLQEVLGRFGFHNAHPRTGRTRAGPREKSAAVAAGAGLGPGTEGMRREAVIGSTGEVRQERLSALSASGGRSPRREPRRFYPGTPEGSVKAFPPRA